MGETHAALSVNLAPLVGVRASANAHVVLFHVYMFWRMFLPGGYEAVWQRSAHNPIIWLFGQGTYSADIFLVISACLAMYHLLPALEGTRNGGTERSMVLNYWLKRVLRILPAYISANLLALLLLSDNNSIPPLSALSKALLYCDCPAGLRAFALFVGNLMPVPKMCGAHLWSVLVSIHMYIVLPLLMCALHPRQPGFRQRLSVTLVAAVVGGTVLRYVLALRIGLHLPIGDFMQPKEFANLMAMLESTYMTTQGRIAQAAAGAALGLLLRSPAAISWLSRRPLLLSATAIALQTACYRATVGFVDFLPPPGTSPLPKSTSAVVAALFIHGSPLFSLAIMATLLAVILRTDPLHALMARFLSHPAWEAPARLSYGVYLLHELVKYGVTLAVPGLLNRLAMQAPVTALAVLSGATLGGSYAAAWLQWHVVERPFLK